MLAVDNSILTTKSFYNAKEGKEIGAVRWYIFFKLDYIYALFLSRSVPLKML
jgi:hypothetical protein